MLCHVGHRSVLAVTTAVILGGAGVALTATPALAAVGPAAGHAFSVTATAQPPSGDPILSWRDLSTGATGSYATPAGEPSISPDGTTIAAVTQVGVTGLSRISLFDVQTGAVTTLTTPAGDQSDREPAWSSDGSTVYFTRETDITNTDVDFVYSVPAAGGSVTQVVSEASSSPSPKAGSSTLAYVPEADPSCLLKTSTSGAATCVLTAGQMPVSDDLIVLPRWSPDGTKIAASYIGSTGAGIILVSPSGGPIGSPRWTVADDGSNAFELISSVSWTPDGSQLIFGEGKFDFDTFDAVDQGTLRSLDVATGDVSTVQAGGHHGSDTWFPSTFTTTPSGSEFVAVDPVRIADTRTGLGGHSGMLGAGATMDLPVTGSDVSGTGLTVPSTATAVVLNVTVTNPTTTSYLSVYPGPVSAAPPLVSNLNYTATLTVANAVTVSVPVGGDIVLRNALGSTHVIVDIAGYYLPTSAADPNATPYAPVVPTRILDTRTNLGSLLGAFGPGETRDLQVTGASVSGTGLSVPSTASAVVFNLTAVGGAVGTYVSAFPTGGSVPLVSNLNLGAGDIRANLVTVKVGTGGKVTLFNAVGTVHLIVDVAGYYDASAPDDFVPLSPVRIFDTRDGTYNPGGTAPIGPANASSVLVTGTLTTSTGQAWVPANADAAVYNLTGTSPSTSTYVSALTSSPSQTPTISNINLRPGATVPNLAITKIGAGGQIYFYNAQGTTAVLADLAGYFRPVGG